MEKINELKRNFSRRIKKLTNKEDEENPDLARKVNEESKCINWSIENIDVHPLRVGEFLESPPFYSGFSNGTKWILRLYPSGRNEENSGTVGLYIFRVSSEEKCHFKCQFTLQDSSVTGDNFDDESIFQDSDEYGTDEFLSSEDLSEIKVLKIECNLSIKYPNKEKKFNLSSKEGFSHCSCNLSRDIENMCLQEKHADATLQVADVKIPVHKAVLATRSKKFSEIFKSYSKEACSPEIIQVEDVEESVMKQLLHYIYSGKVRDITVHEAISLYTAAVKYSLEELSRLCLNIILTSMSTDNFCRVAGLSDIHHCPELKSATKSFFCSYSSQILESEEWKSFVSDRRSMALELMEALTSEYKINKSATSSTD